MTTEGPALAELLRRAREVSPLITKPDVPIYPIVCDYVRAKGLKPDLKTLKQLVQTKTGAVVQARPIAYAIWILMDPGLLVHATRFSHIEKFFGSELAELSQLVSIEEMIEDDDRREEFVRRCLRAVGLRAAGETENYAADRLKSLDSIEAKSMEAVGRERLERAMEVAKAMREKAAQAAAAKVSRE